jgi:hypothetical protein
LRPSSGAVMGAMRAHAVNRAHHGAHAHHGARDVQPWYSRRARHDAPPPRGSIGGSIGAGAAEQSAEQSAGRALSPKSSSGTLPLPRSWMPLRLSAAAGAGADALVGGVGFGVGSALAAPARLGAVAASVLLASRPPPSACT